METRKENIYEVIENDIVISKFFDAPRELLWKAWTEPDKITVINYGVKIADGTPDEIKNNSEVIKAYLGSDAESDDVA
jgi:hypothetical protein